MELVYSATLKKHIFWKSYSRTSWAVKNVKVSICNSLTMPADKVNINSICCCAANWFKLPQSTSLTCRLLDCSRCNKEEGGGNAPAPLPPQSLSARWESAQSWRSHGGADCQPCRTPPLCHIKEISMSDWFCALGLLSTTPVQQYVHCGFVLGDSVFLCIALGFYVGILCVSLYLTGAVGSSTRYKWYWGAMLFRLLLEA